MIKAGNTLWCDGDARRCTTHLQAPTRADLHRAAQLAGWVVRQHHNGDLCPEHREQPTLGGASV